jgi:hypothetical protein
VLFLFFLIIYEFYARINSLTNTAGIQTSTVLFANNQFFGSVDIDVHPNTPIRHVRFSPKWPNVPCTSQAKIWHQPIFGHQIGGNGLGQLWPPK